MSEKRSRFLELMGQRCLEKSTRLETEAPDLVSVLPLMDAMMTTVQASLPQQARSAIAPASTPLQGQAQSPSSREASNKAMSAALSAASKRLAPVTSPRASPPTSSPTATTTQTRTIRPSAGDFQKTEVDPLETRPKREVDPTAPFKRTSDGVLVLRSKP